MDPLPFNRAVRARPFGKTAAGMDARGPAGGRAAQTVAAAAKSIDAQADDRPAGDQARLAVRFGFIPYRLTAIKIKPAAAAV
jgi:hypothetical protein